MIEKLRVLLIEDSPDDAELILDRLRSELFSPTWARVDDPEAFRAALESGAWDILLLDHSMPRLQLPFVLQSVRAVDPDVPLIIVSGSITDGDAVTAMRSGAQDYVLKDNLSRLGPAIRRELREAGERRSRRAAEEQVDFLARFDERTGLPNRASLTHQVREVIAGSPNDPVTVFVVAFPGLRRLQEAFGLEYSDDAFVACARQIGEALPGVGMVARISESRLGVATTGGERAGIAQRLVEAFARPLVVDGQHVGLQCRVGYASYPGHADSPERLIQLAEIAVRRAHQQPGGTAAFDQEFTNYAMHQLVLLNEVQTAIAQDLLTVAYQPKVEMRTGVVSSMEALVRWSHPTFGAVPPSQFVPLLEQSGNVGQLTRWMLNAVASQQRRWTQQGLNLPVAVNLSAQDLTPGLPAQLFEIADQWGLPPSAFGVEVTESSILADARVAVACLDTLGEAGVVRAVDDFGVGQSSLGQLGGLPVDELKVDQLFVSGARTDPRDRAILKTICNLGSELGMRIVAEGVEYEADVRLLQEMRCDVGQGYYFSRPLAADDVLPWLDARRGMAA